jgi:hypothetical protein
MSEMNSYRPRAAWLLILLLAACSSNASTPTDQSGDHPDGQQDITDVIYVGGVTDEALRRLLDVTPKNDPRQAVSVDSPDLNAPVPSGSAATFQFHLASAAMRAPGLRGAPGAAVGHSPSKWQRSFHELLQLLAPERIAHAHGAPYNGTAYYLVISDADAKQRLQVFTTDTSFTPEAVDWQNLVQAPQPLKLEIISAFFEENDIPADGGPYLGGTFSFQIE